MSAVTYTIMMELFGGSLQSLEAMTTAFHIPSIPFFTII
jgi:hypothetical protein